MSSDGTGTRLSPRGSRIVSEAEYQRLIAEDWARWRGGVDEKLENIEEKLVKHMLEDQHAFGALTSQLGELAGKVTLIVSSFAGAFLLLNVVIGVAAVYIAWIK